MFSNMRRRSRIYRRSVPAMAAMRERKSIADQHDGRLWKLLVAHNTMRIPIGALRDVSFSGTTTRCPEASSKADMEKRTDAQSPLRSSVIRIALYIYVGFSRAWALHLPSLPFPSHVHPLQRGRHAATTPVLTFYSSSVTFDKNNCQMSRRWMTHTNFLSLHHSPPGTR